MVGAPGQGFPEEGKGPQIVLGRAPKLSYSFLSLPRIPTFKTCPESIPFSRPPLASPAPGSLSWTPETASPYPPCLLPASPPSYLQQQPSPSFKRKNQGVLPCALASELGCRTCPPLGPQHPPSLPSPAPAALPPNTLVLGPGLAVPSARNPESPPVHTATSSLQCQILREPLQPSLRAQKSCSVWGLAGVLVPGGRMPCAPRGRRACTQ